jgi:hypothetical protein
LAAPARASYAIETTIDGVPAVLPELSTTLLDGAIGWYQRTQLDCLRAAVATATQVSYDDCGEIPHLGALEKWAEARGYRYDWHPGEFPPTDRPRWIGFTAVVHRSARHTIVGAFTERYFDPASGWLFPGGLKAPAVTELDYAITLTPKGNQ